MADTTSGQVFNTSSSGPAAPGGVSASSGSGGDGSGAYPNAGQPPGPPPGPPPQPYGQPYATAPPYTPYVPGPPFGSQPEKRIPVNTPEWDGVSKAFSRYKQEVKIWQRLAKFRLAVIDQASVLLMSLEEKAQSVALGID